MHRVQVYSRPGCHLCENLIEEILLLTGGRAELDVLNVDTRADWQEKYGMRVPVVEIDGRCISQHPLDRSALQRVLDGTPGEIVAEVAASDRIKRTTPGSFDAG